MSDLDAIYDLVDQLGHWLPRARAYTGLGDGVRSPNPSGSGGGDIAYSDPVGENVSGQHPALDAAEDAIAGARRQLAEALAAVHGMLPPPNLMQRINARGGDLGCASCKRAKVFSSTRPGSTLCEWCYRWRLANEALPPLGVLEARAQGKRITTRIVEEAARAARRHTKRKKARR